ncbi:MAG: hypothetical protein P4L43_05000 [Syntrophobacteraceae bacterium]|nr:hypothetical protein [Syntrophobacteraceae bacterium]
MQKQRLMRRVLDRAPLPEKLSFSGSGDNHERIPGLFSLKKVGYTAPRGANFARKNPDRNQPDTLAWLPQRSAQLKDKPDFVLDLVYKIISFALPGRGGKIEAGEVLEIIARDSRAGMV